MDDEPGWAATTRAKRTTKRTTKRRTTEDN
jgi:hypothetical protein